MEEKLATAKGSEHQLKIGVNSFLVVCDFERL